MAKWLINALQGLDYSLPFLMLPLLVIQFSATAYIIIAVGLMLLRIMDVLVIDVHYPIGDSQFRASMRSSIIYWPQHRFRSLLIYVFMMIVLGLVKILIVVLK